MTLPVGLALPTTPGLTNARAFGELARVAEQLGYAHLWVSDHVLLPPGSHVPPTISSTRSRRWRGWPR